MSCGEGADTKVNHGETFVQASVPITHCMLCGSHDRYLYVALHEHLILVCTDCGLVYSDKAPALTQDYYAAEYFAGQEQCHKDYEKDKDSNVATFAARLQDAERRLNRTGLVLDLGCAFGHLEVAALETGFSVIAADISLAAVRFARQKYGVHGVVADAAHPPFRSGSFDLICLYDVIEHVVDPVAVLREARRLLKPNGLLHIVTPDVRSLSARILGRYWFHYKPFEHVAYFSRATLMQAMRKAGWEIDHIGAVPSRMSLATIVHKLSYYSARWSGWVLGWLSKLQLAKMPIPVPIGEIEVWASIPKVPMQANPPRDTNQGLAQLMICPSCKGEVNSDSESSLRCTACGHSYTVDDGIPLLIAG